MFPDFERETCGGWYGVRCHLFPRCHREVWFGNEHWPSMWVLRLYTQQPNRQKMGRGHVDGPQVCEKYPEISCYTSFAPKCWVIFHKHYSGISAAVCKNKLFYPQNIIVRHQNAEEGLGNWESKVWEYSQDNTLTYLTWLRAKGEADFINSKKHPVLQSVGGVISCEMQTPKLLWIKKYSAELNFSESQYFALEIYLCQDEAWFRKKKYLNQL